MTNAGPDTAIFLASAETSARGSNPGRQWFKPPFMNSGAFREEGAWPSAPCDRRATKPAGVFRENPSGGGSFAGGLRWLGRQSLLCGCSDLAAFAAAKISRRGTPPNLQTRSKPANHFARPNAPKLRNPQPIPSRPKLASVKKSARPPENGANPWALALGILVILMAMMAQTATVSALELISYGKRLLDYWVALF